MLLALRCKRVLDDAPAARCLDVKKLGIRMFKDLQKPRTMSAQGEKNSAVMVG